MLSVELGLSRCRDAGDDKREYRMSNKERSGEEVDRGVIDRWLVIISRSGVDLLLTVYKRSVEIALLLRSSSEQRHVRLG